MIKRIIILFAALVCSVPLFAQGAEGSTIPKEVFYLMPEMGKGTIYFTDRGPVNGKFNICAVDNSVRFLDAEGTELALENAQNVLQLVIDGVTFIYREGIFYRLQRVTPNTFVAIKRDVRILRDAQDSSYGMKSNTTAVESYSGLIDEHGRYIDLPGTRDIPYMQNESAFLYLRGMVLQPTKRNFIKCFPDKKNEISEWFSQNKKVDPTSVKEITDLCKKWGVQ